MAVSCYLGIDVGTQGLTALLVKSDGSNDDGNSNSNSNSSTTGKAKTSLKVLSFGEGSYGFVPDLPEGCYEQNPADWETALVQALTKIQKDIDSDFDSFDDIDIKAICITGQMHGCVMIDRDGKSIGTARLWCDARNQEEADELSQLFGERMPKRLTAARFLWSLKHEPEKAEKCVAITTPAGYIAHRLTSTTTTSTSEDNKIEHKLPPLLLLDEAFDAHVRTMTTTTIAPSSLKDFLPKIRTAGDARNNRDEHGSDQAVVLNPSILESDGWLWEVRALLTRDRSSCSGIMVAPAEGDQPTALAASLIGEPGMISCSFGTSVVANMVGKSTSSSSSNSKCPEPKNKASSLTAVDRFNAVNGQPISMVWLRNGTTYLNRMVDSYGGDFESLLKQAVEAPADCGGLLALPFLDDEPGLDIKRGGTAMVVGFNSNSNSNRNSNRNSSNSNSDGNDEDGNHRAGNVIKAAMVSVMFNLFLGTQQVEEAEAIDDDDERATTRKEIVLTGGLTKTPQTGQILANIFDRPVRLLEAADEGGAWGAALLAKYYDVCEHDQNNMGDDRSQSQSESEYEYRPPSFDRWLAFLNTVEAEEEQAFYPQAEHVETYRTMLAKYKKLLELQPLLDEVMNGP
eukprot:CAMPEP_0168219338 /NCGR_PEP_ID=MMETSP0140_2-20121125/8512_1 /TAXON_ID=44445 /ORGANISM="Pseudo-nitzschia australis, Strain 10249 10 AB" /LENGTH=626 /DNA_ID=CAMNT_0008147723 /DNA_START=61 /DNA_END=1942 /DNA_ORIENTATION=-